MSAIISTCDQRGLNMKDVFRKDVSESLKRLYLVLLKKSKSKNLSDEQFQVVMKYLNFLKIVAVNNAAYCNPAYFNTTMQKLGFDVVTGFTFFDIDGQVAQCVYDIMVCRHDYICHTNKDNSVKNESRPYKYNFSPCKYKSQQEAVEAMRLFKRDSIEMAGGIIPCTVRKLWDTVFNRSK